MLAWLGWTSEPTDTNVDSRADGRDGDAEPSRASLDLIEDLDIADGLMELSAECQNIILFEKQEQKHLRSKIQEIEKMQRKLLPSTLRSELKKQELTTSNDISALTSHQTQIDGNRTDQSPSDVGDVEAEVVSRQHRKTDELRQELLQMRSDLTFVVSPRRCHCDDSGYPVAESKISNASNGCVEAEPQNVCHAEEGSMATLLLMPSDILLRIEGCFDEVVLKDICALGHTCRFFGQRLQLVKRDGSHRAYDASWEMRLRRILGDGCWGHRAPFSPKLGLQAHEQCIWLGVMVRMLGNALNNMDWFALVDIKLMMAISGIRGVGALSQTSHILVGHQKNLATLQGIHWLWDIASGQSEPWNDEDAYTLTAGAIQLDPLRKWLRRHVSKSFVTRSALMDQELEEEQCNWFKASAALVASFTVLAVQSTAPTWSLTAVHGLEIALPFRELTEFLQVSLLMLSNGVEDVRIDCVRWRVAALLILSRCVHGKDSGVWEDSSASTKQGWQGTYVHWKPTSRSGRSEPQGKQAMHFPELSFEKQRLCSKQGNSYSLLKGTASSSSEVQFDTTWDEDLHTYIGEIEWRDPQDGTVSLGRSLPVRLFLLDPALSGLSFCSTAQRSKWKDAQPQNYPEIVGVIGRGDFDICGVFHLSAVGMTTPNIT